jgi:GDP-4-dehydro-6-deoxy-D-mannose reductase
VSGAPLVTGATGFAGSHLVDLLLETEPLVHAWAHPSGRPAPDRGPRVRWAAVDLLDRAAVSAALSAARPSVIYHCAGIADVHGSWRAPARALEVNALGTWRLLDAARDAGFSGRVLVTGSALVYQPSAAAIGEDDPIGPTSPYGVSKLAQEMAAARSGMDVLLARPFNHAGARQDDGYVTSAFARQIAEIERGERPPVLHVGNLESRRDITDVRDVVRAYALMAAHARTQRPYNVCRGTAYRIRDLLDLLLAQASVTIAVETDPSRLRPSDNPIVLGSHARLTAETGWTPEIPIERTLADILDYWRGRRAAA